MTRLKHLCSLEGVSGREDAVRRYILQELAASPAPMTVSVDPLGNVIARVEGKSARQAPFCLPPIWMRWDLL